MQKPTRININTVPEVFSDHSEAREVLIAAIFVNQYVDETEPIKEGEEVEDQFVNINETLKSNALEHFNHVQEDNNEQTDISDSFEIDFSLTPASKPNVVNIQRPNTLAIKLKKDRRYDEYNLMGACLDTGAQSSVCGIGQPVVYEEIYSGSLSRQASATQFKLGEQITKSIGQIRIKFPIHENTHFEINVDVIQLDVPLITGLYILRSCKQLVNYVDNMLHYCNEDIKRPLTHKHGHVFLV